jgi:imidazolonepropionase
MTTLIKNIGQMYSADTTGEYGTYLTYTDCAILLENKIISTIYEEPDPEIANVGRIIDAEGKTILPGFVDAHTHPVFWNTRESEFTMRIKGLSYEEIAQAGGGIRNSARSFQKASRTEIKEVTEERIKTFLEYGTTTIEAKSGYGLSRESELKALEIIADLNNEQALEMIPTFLGAHEVPDEYQSNRKAYIDLLVNDMIPEVAKKKLARYCDVFCEKNVFSLEETKYILHKGIEYHLPGRIHADELHAFGAAELAVEMKAITADHLVKVSDKGIQMMAESGVIPVLLPATTFFLRKDEYAPARKMISAGCEVAVSTDFNPGSSMTQNMQLIWTIGALKLGMLSGELLWATTYVPAKSLQMEHKIGCIGEGKQADLIILDIPNLDFLAYHMGINHVALTIKKGKVVFKKNN